MQTMHRFQKINYHALAVAGGVTRGEFFALNMIHGFCQSNPERRGVYVSELAAQLRVSSPAVSRMLRALEQRGLLERSVEKDDRRNTYVVLTEMGETVREKEEQHMLHFCQRVLERLGEGETEHMIALWNRLADVMTEEIAKET